MSPRVAPGGGAARTGKEEDVEVGLTYFGKRYLNPLLGRWVSPDPLGVHEPGKADLNLYAYVHGRVLQATDPAGLQDVTTKADLGMPPPPGVEAPKGDAVIGAITIKSGPAAAAQSPGAPANADAAGKAIAALMGSVATGYGKGAAAGAVGGATAGFVCGASVACGAAVGAAGLGYGAYSLYKNWGSISSDPSAVAEAIGSIGGASQTTVAGLQAGSYGRALTQARITNPTKGELNCTLCAQAMDKNLSGPLTQARAGNINGMDLFHFESQMGGTFRPLPSGPVDARAAVEQALLESGLGSRGIVFGDRRPDIGHVWNAQNMWGKVRFIDGQSGGPARFSGQGYVGFELMVRGK